MRQNQILVTGLGFVTSIGSTKAEVTNSLKESKHGLKPVTFLDNPDLPVKLAGTVDGFDVSSPYYQKWRYPAEYKIPKELIRGMAPHGVYSYCAIEQALHDAGIDPAELNDENTGLYCASAGSAFLLHHHLKEFDRNRGMRGSPFGVVSTISGTLNFNLGAHYRIRGANCGFVSACSSSAHAIGHAVDQLRLGRLNRVIVVGAEDINAESTLPFSAMRALSTESDPEKASLPFDEKRNGFVASGGAVALILERSDVVGAERSVYGEIVDWAQSCDGFNPAISEPDGNGLSLAMQRVVDTSGVKKADISYIHAHATSTVQGDRSEAKAIETVFGSEGCLPAVSSTKGLTGHTLSMAGAMEVAFCMLALREKFLPGNAHLQTPETGAIASLNLLREAQETSAEYILKNSCGFGGSNVSLLLRSWK